MKVEILHLEQGAKKAKGTVIIIDVFRAFTLEAYLFAQGCGTFAVAEIKNFKFRHNSRFFYVKLIILFVVWCCML